MQKGFDKAASERARWASVQRMLWWLKSMPCADCGGVFHPVAMDFDHVRGVKWENVWIIRTMRRLQEELLKCDLVCANCHRVRTWKRRKHAESTG